MSKLSSSTPAYSNSRIARIILKLIRLLPPGVYEDVVIDVLAENIEPKLRRVYYEMVGEDAQVCPQCSVAATQIRTSEMDGNNHPFSCVECFVCGTRWEERFILSSIEVSRWGKGLELEAGEQ